MDTIFALASARGKAGIAIIRLSGPLAHESVSRLCQLPPPRTAGLRNLTWNQQVLDQSVVIIFEPGASFTGEAIAELHLHGSVAVVSAVIGVLSGFGGLRQADPGEFTRRALENGRLDLTQVEGLADLIDSETESQRKQAMRVLSGAIGRKVEAWRRDLVRAAALIEATIDFADEDVPVNVLPEVRGLIAKLLADLKQELDGSVAAERIRDGYEVAIIGPPNIGKSTLFNALAKRDAAITSEFAGTTRDVIEVRMDIGGLAVTILDTAGLRETGDVVEKMGVSRAMERAHIADLRVFLVSGSDDPLLMKPLANDIVVLGKADTLLNREGAVSGITGEGIPRLIEEICSRLGQKAASAGILIRERHKRAIVTAINGLEVADVSLNQGLHMPELVAADLRAAADALSVILGRINVEDLLDEIFKSFCIGK